MFVPNLVSSINLFSLSVFCLLFSFILCPFLLFNSFIFSFFLSFLYLFISFSLPIFCITLFLCFFCSFLTLSFNIFPFFLFFYLSFSKYLQFSTNFIFQIHVFSYFNFLESILFVLTCFSKEITSFFLQYTLRKSCAIFENNMCIYKCEEYSTTMSKNFESLRLASLQHHCSVVSVIAFKSQRLFGYSSHILLEELCGLENFLSLDAFESI